MQRRRARPGRPRQPEPDRLDRRVAQREHLCQMPGLVLRGSARAQDPEPGRQLGQVAEIPLALRGQHEPHPLLARLAHIAVHLGPDAGRGSRAVIFVEDEALRRLAHLPDPLPVPLAVALRHRHQHFLADPPVPGQHVPGQHVHGRRLAVRLRRPLRRDGPQVHGRDPHMPDIERRRLEHERPLARERRQDAHHRRRHRLPAHPVGRLAHQVLHLGLAHRRQAVQQCRNRVALRPAGRVDLAGLEQQVHRVPPERVRRQIDSLPCEGRFHLTVPPARISMRLCPRAAVLPHPVDRVDHRRDRLRHAVRNAPRSRRRQDQRQQVRQERPLRRKREPAAELRVAGIDRMRARHLRREPPHLVAPVLRQRLADHRDQPRRGRADIDHREQGQAPAPALQAEGQRQRPQQHALATPRNAVHQVEPEIAALLQAVAERLAVLAPEQVVRPVRPHRRRRPEQRQHAEHLFQRRQRRLRRASRGKPRHRPRERLEHVAHERRELALPPALADLLHAPELPCQPGLAFLSLDPGQEPDPQPHDGLLVPPQHPQSRQRIAHMPAVFRRDRQYRRRRERDRRPRAREPASFKQQREPERDTRLRKPAHQFRERPLDARPEHHVHRPVKPAADAQPTRLHMRLANQELRRQRRRKAAQFRRLRKSRPHLVLRTDRPPVRTRRVRAVQQHPHRPDRFVGTERLRHQPRLLQQRGHGRHERLVARRQAVDDLKRTLRFPDPRQPRLQPAPQLALLAAQLRPLDHGGPGPAGKRAGLAGQQVREPLRALRDHVPERKTEPLALAPLPPGRRVDRGPRRIGRALQHDVQPVPPVQKRPVEAPLRELHEPAQLLRPGNRPRALDAHQRYQRAVMAEQRVAGERHGLHERFERLAAHGPPVADRVVELAKHGRRPPIASSASPPSRRSRDRASPRASRWQPGRAASRPRPDPSPPRP